MSFLKSTPELKAEVLAICGELTDGNSPYDALAVQYLNDVYQGVLAGGNEFGIDVAEPWVWAQSKRPILLTLVPAETGIATLTQDSNSGTFSVAPTISLAGRYFRVESRADIYRIATHAANATAFTLDQPYIEAGGALNFMAFQIDYNVTDDSIIIDSTNNKIDFIESGSTVLTATLTSGVYTPTTLCTEVALQMNAAGGAPVYTCTFNTLSRKFTITQTSGTLFTLSFDSGTNAAVSASDPLGFDIEDQSGALTYTSGYSLSGILRLTKPITMYREAPTYAQSARDSGKIFNIDDNTFLREYPMSRMTQDVPDKFCVVEMSPTGLWKIRVNASVLNPIRAEVNHIPVTRRLVDNEASFPSIPGSYSKYLVYGAAHFIMLDKSDSKAEQYFNLARAKLMALMNDNRKGMSLAGNNFGKLIPRRGIAKVFGWSR